MFGSHGMQNKPYHDCEPSHSLPSGHRTDLPLVCPWMVCMEIHGTENQAVHAAAMSIMCGALQAEMRLMATHELQTTAAVSRPPRQRLAAE